MRPGTIRIHGEGYAGMPMDPREVIVEVCQHDGAWLRLPTCGLSIEVRDDQPVQAHITVEPVAVDLCALVASVTLAS